jgi:hypothetical protein
MRCRREADFILAHRDSKNLHDTLVSRVTLYGDVGELAMQTPSLKMKQLHFVWLLSVQANRKFKGRK